MKGQTYLLILLFSILGPLQAKTGHSKAIPDIRVLIDVSGSMKKNDPRQLRKPAVKLLVGLMPDGMYSGIWTFGQYVNMQVKYGKVTPAWRALARKEANKIHSRALYTNIEEAIQRASFNWNKPDKRFKRNLILLTDGKVDISRDNDVNEASRQRIIKHWLPKLKKARVRVHSIALSSEVDRELLSLLSAETGGWYEQVNSAEELQRVFLRLFEKSVKRDSLPIKGNRFHVDVNVKDMTMLVFHQPNAKKLHINTPKSGRWNENNAPGHVTWFNEDGYDLVTVKKPDAGDWILETETDPDNRVLIVTNMKLKVNELPEHLLAGENFDIEAALYNKEVAVTRQDFLKLVQFSVIDQLVGDVETLSFTLKDSGEIPDRKSKDGIFSQRFNAELAEGLHTLIIRADGATFQRELRHTFQLHANIANVDIVPQGKAFQLRLRANEQLLDIQSVKLHIISEDLKENKWLQNKNVWTLPLPEDMAGKAIKIKLTAKRKNGSDVTKHYTRQIGTIEKKQSDKKEQTHETPSKDKDLQQTKTADNLNKTPKEEVTDKKSGSNWILIAWVVALINIVLLIAGILGWMFYHKRKVAHDEAIDAEIDV